MNIFNFDRLIDYHCHLNSNDFDNDRDRVVSSFVDSGIDFVIDQGNDLTSSIKSLELSTSYQDRIFSAVGIQPEVYIPKSDMFVGLDKSNYVSINDDFDKIESVVVAGNEKIVMVGETGIDLYWLKKNIEDLHIIDKSTKLQIELFTRHISLANKMKLPLSIHHRNSLELCLDVLQKENNKVDAVFHSFVDDYNFAKKVLDAGYKIGINGIVTYKSAGQIRDALKKIIGSKKIESPIDLYNLGIVLETDAPFLGVGDLRGKRNEPKMIKQIFDHISNL